MSDVLLDEPVCGLTQRIIHVHAALACNLTCKHCYSSSGPAVKSRLDAAVVCQTLSEAAELGYQVATFSGGEPTMHPGLVTMLQHARRCGLRTNLITNGTLLTQRLVSELESCLDLLAISLDGPPELHNQMRQSPTSFARMVEGLSNVALSRIPYGLLFTLTEENWEHLVWAGEFATEQGARLLQIHPLENTGRAATGGLASLAPTAETLGKAYLLTLAMQQRYGERLQVQFDIFHRDYLVQQPQSVYAERPNLGCELPPAAALTLIILESDGTISPLAYGFSRDYKITNIHDQNLLAAFPAFLANSYDRLIALCAKAYREQVLPSDFPLLNWYELIVEASHHGQARVAI